MPEADTQTTRTAPSAPEVRSDELVFLDPASTKFRTEAGRLQMRREGEDEWREITLARLFPLSRPDELIAVIDKGDKEIGLLRDLHGIHREELGAIRAELRRRYLIPEILRIVACRDKFRHVEWTVDTDRGRVVFLTHLFHEQQPEIIPGHVALTDVEGNRYDIPDVEALDPESRHLLEQRI